MSFEIEGKLIVRYDTVQRTETFKTREFVIEKSDEISGRTILNYIKFQCVQDKTSMPDRFNIGDHVKVFFNIKGTKWNKDGRDNYITNLDAWRMEHIRLSEQSTSAAVVDKVIDEPVDDLPF